MLLKLDRINVEKYIDYAYELSQDLSTSAFPTYMDTIKTKDDFFNNAYSSFEDSNSDILLFKRNDEVCGWIHYYVLEEDKYIGLKVFNIDTKYELAIKEFIEYLSVNYNGYTVYFGFPVDNVEANKHMKRIGMKEEDDKTVFVLHFNQYDYMIEDSNIIEINTYNYHYFKELHDTINDIYWTSDRLYHAINGGTAHPWFLYVLKVDHHVLGSIYFTYYKEMVEIFGIDYIDNVFNRDVMIKLLIKALNKSKEDGIKYLTFFADDRESAVLRKLGMVSITDYILYIVTL